MTYKQMKTVRHEWRYHISIIVFIELILRFELTILLSYNYVDIYLYIHIHRVTLQIQYYSMNSKSWTIIFYKIGVSRCMFYLVLQYQYKMNAEECNKVVKDEIIKSRSSSISIKFISKKICWPVQWALYVVIFMVCYF